MDPINYMIDYVDPVQRAMTGYADGMGIVKGQQDLMRGQQDAQVQLAELGLSEQRVAQGDRTLDQADTRLGMDQQRLDMDQQQFAADQQAQAQEQARMQAMQADFEALADKENRTAEDYANLATKYPEFGDELLESWDAMDKPVRQANILQLAQVHNAIETGSTDVAKGILGDQVEALRGAGRAEEADVTESILAILETDPQAASALTGYAISILGDGEYDDVLGQGRKAPTVQSSVNLPGGLTKLVMNDGEVRVRTADNQVLTGKQAQDAIIAAEDRQASLEFDKNQARGLGANSAEIQTGGTAAATVEAAKKAQEIGFQAFEAVGKIRSNISNLDRAIDAIDSGAKTGQIESRAPTWNQATLELRQVASELGLDVVGSVTFGALSEGELRLAMTTALPTNMNEAGLRQWLVEKKTAQEKLMGYMDEQARFLSRPGNTLSGWLDRVDTSARASGDPAPSVATGDDPEVDEYFRQLGLLGDG